MDGSVEILWIWFLSVDARKFRANLLHFPCTLLKLLLRYVTFIRIVGDLEFGMGWNGCIAEEIGSEFDTIQKVIRCCFICFILCRLEMTSRNLSSSKKPRGRRGLEGSIGWYVSKLSPKLDCFILKMKQFYGYNMI